MNHMAVSENPGGHTANVFGETPTAAFVMDDGSLVYVEHHGSHVEVRHVGKRGGSGLVIEPRSSNSIEIRTV